MALLPRCKDEVYRLVTTVLDPERAPAAELAALYHERWEIENAYDEVKHHLLGVGARLRGKTPGLVGQEIEGLLLAHYAVRYLIHQAAREAHENPDDLSFVHATRAMRRRRCWTPNVILLITKATVLGLRAGALDGGRSNFPVSRPFRSRIGMSENNAANHFAVLFIRLQTDFKTADGSRFAAYPARSSPGASKGARRPVGAAAGSPPIRVIETPRRGCAQ